LRALIIDIITITASPCSEAAKLKHTIDLRAVDPEGLGDVFEDRNFFGEVN
jgi:hypothetical protein